MRFHVEPTQPMTDQAAENEIDRLLRTEGELRAEVARLRAVLERIGKGDWNVCIPPTNYTVQQYARRALEPKP
jgi:hypothetical protein